MGASSKEHNAMSRRVWLVLIGLEIVALCVCLALVVALIVASNILSAPPTPIAASVPTPSRAPLTTPTRLSTETPAPTFTRVIPPPTVGATRAATASPTRTLAPMPSYNIVVPTPTAPPMIYPITFSSSLKIVTYPVIGQTLTELSKSLDAQAIPEPREPGSRYYALTEWFLSARWVTHPTARGCEVESGSITLAMTMTLPALTATTGMPHEVLNRWNVFVNNTITHESGHVKINLQGARDYQRGLGNSAPALDCNALGLRLDDEFDRALDALTRAGRDYDARTQHGVTQGAVFP
jgi:predicted secreted Zn-dependent protease